MVNPKNIACLFEGIRLSMNHFGRAMDTDYDMNCFIFSPILMKMPHRLLVQRIVLVLNRIEIYFSMQCVFYRRYSSYRQRITTTDVVDTYTHFQFYVHFPTSHTAMSFRLPLKFHSFHHFVCFPCHSLA